MIILMVLLHLGQCCLYQSKIVQSVLNTINFFVPWFFIKCGLFARKETLSTTFRKSYGRLVKPFIVFSILGHALWCVQVYLEGDDNPLHYLLSPFKCVLLHGSVAGNGPLWFLFSLFVVRLSFSFLLNKNANIVLVLLLSALFGFCTTVVPLPLPEYIGNISLGLSFCSAGYIMKFIDFHKYNIILGGGIFVTTKLFIPSSVDMAHNWILYGNYFVYFIQSILGFVIVNYLFTKTMFGRISILQYLGRESMGLLCIHILVIRMCFLLWDIMQIHFSAASEYYLILIILVLTFPLLNKLFKKFGWL